MNREQDFDLTIRRWLDDGADQAPERFIWAALDDVERIAQRGAWLASLEGILMKLNLAGPIIGIAAVIVLAFAAYQLLGLNVGGPGPTPTPLPTATAGAITEIELRSIIVTEASAPGGITVDGSPTVGAAALDVPVRPGGPTVDQAQFVDARMSNLNSTEAGGYVSWAALFTTPAAAHQASLEMVTVHTSDTGWGMDAWTDSPGLGDESSGFTGAAYAFDDATLYLWRVDNLILAAVAVGDVAVTDSGAAQLRSIADQMDLRASSSAR